eukprot:TRINITY_DN4758_c0_g1_i1.p2 TRINITY_DN4758_c0_g1~~TRINITY_DN4758_c0_g1_i1.p2  ORF type:complete len:343 (-),score=191.76 TRINITY_DN4758_c0_g1_i1:65-1093(-)
MRTKTCCLPTRRLTLRCAMCSTARACRRRSLMRCAVLKVTDIAGLVRGAADGAGLGNAFLSHIAAVDGIFHMVRAFEDADIAHVEVSVDPVRDLEIIAAELRAKDLAAVRRQIASVSVAKRGQDKPLNARCLIWEKIEAFLADGNDVRNGDWNPKEVDELNEMLLLSAKPVIVLVNLSERDYVRRKNKWLGKIKAWVDEHGGDPIIPLSCALEQRYAECATDEERAKLQEEVGAPSILNKIVTTGYHRLNLIHFFTSGADEVKCWTIRKGMRAPQAAGTIHTDFEEGFISADVHSFDDFKECGGNEAEVKKKGKLRQQGKAYVVQDGDIIFFKFAAKKGGKK